ARFSRRIAERRAADQCPRHAAVRAAEEELFVAAGSRPAVAELPLVVGIDRERPPVDKRVAFERCAQRTRTRQAGAGTPRHAATAADEVLAREAVDLTKIDQGPVRL